MPASPPPTRFTASAPQHVPAEMLARAAWASQFPWVLYYGPMTRFAWLILPLLLSGCIGGSGEPQKRRPSPTLDRPVSPVTTIRPTSRETQQCFTELARANVRYSPLPDRDFGSGCEISGAVELLDIGVPIGGIKAMRCDLALQFSNWVRFAVAPAAKQMLRSELVRVDTYGTYACRNVVGNAASAGRRSEHARANAIDIASFTLRDGRKISIEQGWNSSDPNVREFLRVIRKSACRRFKTVLSPDYNAAHYNHLHFDMGRGPYCA